MSNNNDNNHIDKNSTAFGIWKDNYSLILHHKGGTFHKLAFRRSSNHLCLNLEETVFALLRTNFVLVDYQNKNVVTAENILKELQDSNNIDNLLKIHVYLAFQKLGKSPKPINELTFPNDKLLSLGNGCLADNGHTLNEFKDKYISDNINDNNSNVDDNNMNDNNNNTDNVELHLLLDHFKNNFNLKILDYKVDLSSPIYLVDGLDVYITMPDSPVYNILDTLTDFNKIISVSNLDSVYFLTISNQL